MTVMKKRTLIVVVTVTIVTLAVLFFLRRSREKVTAAPVANTPMHVQPTAPPPAEDSAPTVPNLADQLKLATVRRHEGVEHAFIRQLMANPQLIITDKKKGTTAFDGDSDDKAALKKWAGRQAQIVAENGGFVFDGDSGAEVRIKTADEVAFLLVTDSNDELHIVEYKAVAPGQDFGYSPKPTETHALADRGSLTQFLGLSANLSSNPLPTYEYIYTG